MGVHKCILYASLLVFEGTMNAGRYIKVLEQHMLPSRRCLFQQDSAKLHTAAINEFVTLYNDFLGSQITLHLRGDLLIHHQCAASTWMMRRQPYCARMPTTHQLTDAEETVMKPISVWGLLGGHDGQRSMGKFGQDAGDPLLASLTPLSAAI